ncbi:hypothetical protein HYE82_08870 [Streptomyces sp. BR123]|uniref:WD40 repeat domain-containing protein n=1 Tax=Streptomyces sp. BR123 TaxID=2749828 RepID=UPI0015C4838E|nr:WD40 repeat domain-containing protein [Streptomyces sp. BR123]NXY94502.1 hypothetical protein [Streptomyces sp. BR123]
MRLWRRADPARGIAPAGEPKGHRSDVKAVAFSPDGHTPVTGGRDNTVRVAGNRSGAPAAPPVRGDGRSVRPRPVAAAPARGALHVGLPTAAVIRTGSGGRA